mmetsp:Transcript_20727/g.55765  ORF Transcript_20727/g.55765 Transcript_20727/m.55765 type:complete len:81 (-) Transcript_20727:115-357(-)
MRDGSKREHVRILGERTGVAFTDMLFFEDRLHEVREVAALGVTSVHCPRGLDERSLGEGLRRFRERASREDVHEVDWRRL